MTVFPISRCTVKAGSGTFMRDVDCGSPIPSRLARKISMRDA